VPERTSERVVRAAGGAVLRARGDGTTEIAVVHRPRHDDWSIPKGKLGSGESWEDAALREVEEETGLRCRLVRELGETRYRDARSRPKVVKYWVMELVDGQESDRFVPNDEVDRMEWLDLGAAQARLTYSHDRQLVEELVSR